MNSEQIKQLKAELNSPKRITIIPHVNPDGDAIGSIMGLYHYLKLRNHEVTAMVPNDFPDFLKWIPGVENIVVFEKNEEHAKTILNSSDYIFTLDFNAYSRTGPAQEALENTKAIKIMIDHHQSPDDYAKYMYSDVSMSSTCEMVYNFIEFFKDTNIITKEIATCLYTGIMTDTGSFRFSSTTSRTHRVIAHLIDFGAENAQIHNNLFDSNSVSRLQLLGAALNSLKILKEYNTAYIFLSQSTLDSLNFKKGDTEGFVNYCLSLKGIKLAAIFIENKQDNIIKISLRSKENFSVNLLSRAHFNGGGHTNAAGGKSDLSLEETTKYFESILPEYKTELNA